MSKNRVYTLVNGTKPLSFLLQTRDTPRTPLYAVVTDKDGNETRRSLRYSASHKSPFIDEQETTVNPILKPIEFTDGNLVVDKSDTALQSFLQYHPGNGTIFYEIDHEREAKEQFDFMVLKNRATTLALNTDIEVLGAAARVLLNKDTSKMTSQELRRDCMVLAERDPETFIEMVDSPELERKNVAHLAFERKLLTVRKDGREIFYNYEDNKSRLLVVPTNSEYITELEGYFLTEEGKDLFTFLRKKVLN